MYQFSLSLIYIFWMRSFLADSPNTKFPETKSPFGFWIEGMRRKRKRKKGQRITFQLFK
ncbi:hypothetical protein LguiA_009177 [Lonicera macranthoides]